jgi:tRNA pseudouridine38-40 synthase
MPRLVLEIMYDGTQFHGSQVQGKQATVQLALNDALTTLFRKTVSTYGASRTDEGVHALCNYYHFDIDAELDFDLQYKCNAILPETLAVKKVYNPANPEFNARFDAISRLYRYRIYAKKNPFLANRAFFFPFRLDQSLLDESAAIIKEHTHFESFSKRNVQTKTFTCNIVQSYWEQVGEELHYVVEGNRFLRGMVRGLVGTQLHIARGKATIKDFLNVIESHDCTQAHFDVPGHGLYLENISYPKGALVEVNTRR